MTEGEHLGPHAVSSIAYQTQGTELRGSNVCRVFLAKAMIQMTQILIGNILILLTLCMG